MIEIAGADRIVTIDAHSEELCNFTDLPVINLNPYFLLVEKLRQLIKINPSSHVIIAPDIGGILRCKYVVNALNLPFALIHKGMRLIDIHS